MCLFVCMAAWYGMAAILWLYGPYSMGHTVWEPLHPCIEKSGMMGGGKARVLMEAGPLYPVS